MSEQFFKSFTFVIDEEKPKKQLGCFQKMVNAINAKFNKGRKSNDEKFLKEMLSLKLTLGDSVQINNSDFDYLLIRKEEAKRQKEVNINKYFLMRDFDELIKLLTSYVEEPKRKTIEVEVTIEVPKPKRLKKVTTYEKITIFERWVKIGYKMYRRHLDVYTGEEYILVDGDVYEIKCDRYGQEYLA
jgi:hypothetical protein